MHHPTDRIAHTSLCYTNRGALVGTRNNSMGDSATNAENLRMSLHMMKRSSPCNMVSVGVLRRQSVILGHL